MSRARTVCCAAERCRETVRIGHLMCRDHWLSLPRRMQDLILRSYRARAERPHIYQANVRAAVDLIAQREGAYQDIQFGEVLETQPRLAGGGLSPLTSPSPANFIVPPFGGVAR